MTRQILRMGKGSIQMIIANSVYAKRLQGIMLVVFITLDWILFLHENNYHDSLQACLIEDTGQQMTQIITTTSFWSKYFSLAAETRNDFIHSFIHLFIHSFILLI